MPICGVCRTKFYYATNLELSEPCACRLKWSDEYAWYELPMELLLAKWLFGLYWKYRDLTIHTEILFIAANWLVKDYKKHNL